MVVLDTWEEGFRFNDDENICCPKCKQEVAKLNINGISEVIEIDQFKKEYEQDTQGIYRQNNQSRR
jgi:hypothetical protein